MALKNCLKCEKKLPPPFASSGRQVCSACGWSDKPKDVKLNKLESKIGSNMNSVNTDYQDIVLFELRVGKKCLILTSKEIIIKKKLLFGMYDDGEKYLYSNIIDFHYHEPLGINPGCIYFQLEESDKELTYLNIDNKIPNAILFYSTELEKDGWKQIRQARKIIAQKINPHKYDNFVEGLNGSIELTKTGVSLKRIGGLFSGFPPGTKNIPYRNITAVQFKKPCVTVGFIQLTILGGIESQSGAFQAVGDENTVTFSDEERIGEFEKIKNIIEQKITQSPELQTSSSNKDEFELLEKLAFLRDKGIVTEEEFLLKKKQILGL